MNPSSSTASLQHSADNAGLCLRAAEVGGRLTNHMQSLAAELEAGNRSRMPNAHAIPVLIIGLIIVKQCDRLRDDLPSAPADAKSFDEIITALERAGAAFIALLDAMGGDAKLAAPSIVDKAVIEASIDSMPKVLASALGDRDVTFKKLEAAGIRSELDTILRSGRCTVDLLAGTKKFCLKVHRETFTEFADALADLATAHVNAIRRFATKHAEVLR